MDKIISKKIKLKLDEISDFQDDLAKTIKKLKINKCDIKTMQKYIVALNDVTYDMMVQTKSMLKICLESKLIDFEIYSSFKV